MRSLPVLENLLVESYANEGKCIAHQDGKVVFVKGALPGEVVNAKVTRSKSDFAEAEAVQILKTSNDRQQPFCPHFGYCGGCQWQHMSYEAQLRYKEQSVRETLERLGKITVREQLPIEGSALERHYRNKLEFAFSHREWQLLSAFRENPERINIRLSATIFRVILTAYLM